MYKIKKVLILLLIVFGCQSERINLPENFMGLRLQKKLTGIEAKNFVDKLHINEVAPEKNEIGFYESTNGTAIIYITYYGDPNTSHSEYKRMINKISPENSVFINPEIVEINGREIYRCFGMGQSHYVFANKKELYWVSVDTHIGKEFITQYLAYIN